MKPSFQSPFRSTPLRRPLAFVLAALFAVAGLVACSTDKPDAAPTRTYQADAGAFPVTMKHAFGSTTIRSAPKSVVTLGWGVADAAIAVGVIPTAMEYQAYGANSQGVPTWTAAKLKALGARTPTVLPKSTEAPAYDAIKKADPDLIIATYSGITEAQYKKLSAIAPTVAYTGKPYTTSWQDVIKQTAEALGRTQQATTLLAGIDKQLASEAAAHPELKGKTLAAVWDVGGTFYVYRKQDARVGFMLDLGPTSAPSVDSLANGSQSFYYTLSYEKVGQIKSDILVTYGDTEAQVKTFLGKTYAKSIPAVKTGAVAAITGTVNVAAVSPPTALSLPSALPGLVAKLSAAAKKADAAEK